MKRSAIIAISAASGLALLAGGTAAGAAIAGPVGGDGTIHGCYDVGGNVKVIDASATCPKGYTSLNWSQTGPKGPAGATGPTGPQGAKGDTGAAGPQGDTGAQGPAGPAGPIGATGAAGPAGADGTTVLNGSGAPADSLGTNGDFYLDTRADVLYGPKSGGSWPANGVALVGPPGSPGKGAAVDSLATGDTNCPNGGASVTDGSGNTAYACTGGTGPTGPQGPPGSADLHSFSVLSPLTVVLQPDLGYTPVGLSKQVTTTAAASTYLVNANIVVKVSGGDTSVGCGVFVDGFAGHAGSFGSVTFSEPWTTIPVSDEVFLSAGTHTIEVQCVVQGSQPVLAFADSQLTGFQSS